MDVMSKDQAILAEEAGAAAIMVLEKIPSLIRKEGGVARMVRIGFMLGCLAEPLHCTVSI